MRLAFMGTPEFALASLKALIDAPEHEVLSVVTQPDKPKGRSHAPAMPPVKELALSHGIPVLQPERLKGNAGMVEAIRSLDLDAAVVVAYGKMIPDEMLILPRHGFINVHASLLPRFRGAAPINRAILAGLSRTGVSIMQIDSGMDTGPVFLEAETTIPEDEDAVSLARRLSELGAEKLIETLTLIEERGIRPTPQNNAEATTAPMLTKEEGEIDWSRDAKAIHDMIRGLLPWPCAYTFLDSKSLKILSASYTLAHHDLAPGTMRKQGAGIVVACNGGFIIPGKVQIEGKKAMDSHSFSVGLHKQELILGRGKNA